MAKRACIVHGCPEYAREGASRCEDHDREFKRGRFANGSTGQRGSRPGWRKLREQIWREQGERCGYCNEPNKSFELHHINGRANDDRRSNLIALCRPCHRAVS